MNTFGVLSRGLNPFLDKITTFLIKLQKTLVKT